MNHALDFGGTHTFIQMALWVVVVVPPVFLVLPYAAQSTCSEHFVLDFSHLENATLRPDFQRDTFT